MNTRLGLFLTLGNEFPVYTPSVNSVNMAQTHERYDGPVAPIALSIVGMVVWLDFILFYALYWSEGFDFFQNIIVTIVSLAVAGLLIGLAWLPWYKITGERR